MLILHVGTSRFDAGKWSAKWRAVLEHVATGDEARDLLRLYDYDLLMVDAALLDMTALELVRHIRSVRLELPIIVLTGERDLLGRICVIEAGADDALSEPIDQRELIARIRACVRRTHQKPSSVLRVGPVELRLGSKEIRVHGVHLILTRREFMVLEILMLKREILLSRSAISDHIFGTFSPSSEKNIDVIICRLRPKLADAGAPGIIETVRGMGYIIRDLERKAA